jgi:dihydrodipicolinate synthase/N-acetylneuraminate lyase
VAKNVGGMPIILYNVPPMAGGVAFTVPLIRDLAEIPNIVGIKDTSGNIVQLTEIVQKVKVTPASSPALLRCLLCAIGFVQCTGTDSSLVLLLYHTQLPLASKGKSFSVLAGSGSYFFPALTVGADGGVMALANIIPHVRWPQLFFALFSQASWLCRQSRLTRCIFTTRC